MQLSSPAASLTKTEKQASPKKGAGLSEGEADLKVKEEQKVLLLNLAVEPVLRASAAKSAPEAPKAKMTNQARGAEASNVIALHMDTPGATSTRHTAGHASSSGMLQGMPSTPSQRICMDRAAQAQMIRAH